MDIQEIREKVMRASAGDGDAVLNILLNICDELDDVKRQLEALDSGKSDRPYDPKERL